MEESICIGGWERNERWARVMEKKIELSSFTLLGQVERAEESTPKTNKQEYGGRVKEGDKKVGRKK
jgi:hypothetical protein